MDHFLYLLSLSLPLHLLTLSLSLSPSLPPFPQACTSSSGSSPSSPSSSSTPQPSTFSKPLLWRCRSYTHSQPSTSSSLPPSLPSLRRARVRLDHFLHLLPLSLPLHLQPPRDCCCGEAQATYVGHGHYADHPVRPSPPPSLPPFLFPSCFGSFVSLSLPHFHPPSLLPSLPPSLADTLKWSDKVYGARHTRSGWVIRSCWWRLRF